MKRSIWLLLALSLWLWAGPCSAQPYSVTEAELTRLEEIFNQLEMHNKALMASLTASKQDLTEQQAKVLRYQQGLEQLQQDLVMYRNEITKARLDLATSKASLERANQSLVTYEKEMKRKVRVVSQQRNIAWLVAGVAVYAAVR